MTPLARFLASPAQERRCLIEAVVSLLAARLALLLLPFPCALRLMHARPGRPPADKLRAAEVSEVRRAITRASRHVPFRAACLQQAFAALLMLRRRNLTATVHLGVARGADGLAAHAWSCCGPLCVTGGEMAGDFIEIATFAA